MATDFPWRLLGEAKGNRGETYIVAIHCLDGSSHRPLGIPGHCDFGVSGVLLFPLSERGGYSLTCYLASADEMNLWMVLLSDVASSLLGAVFNC